MGMVTDARIAAWQEEAGIEPAHGDRGEALGEISRLAYELIQLVELERSGIRDGDGGWHGSDPLDGTIRDLIAHWQRFLGKDLCPRCGSHMQATHHPFCEARDGTPTGFADETVRLMIGTPRDGGGEEIPF